MIKFFHALKDYSVNYLRAGVKKRTKKNIKNKKKKKKSQKAEKNQSLDALVECTELSLRPRNKDTWI